MDWEVFDRLYSEEFSIDLIHAWRQVMPLAFLPYFGVDTIFLVFLPFLR